MKTNTKTDLLKVKKRSADPNDGLPMEILFTFQSKIAMYFEQKHSS